MVPVTKQHEAQLVSNQPADPTLEEAISGPYSHEWRKAMQEEFNALNDSKRWILVKLP